MFDLTKIPDVIQKRIAGQEWVYDNAGASGATISIFDDMVLKIESIFSLAQNELQLLYWLDGKLPVPKVIEAVRDNEYSFILMSRLYGETAHSNHNINNMPSTIAIMVKALKMLWGVNTDDCPIVMRRTMAAHFILRKAKNEMCRRKDSSLRGSE